MLFESLAEPDGAGGARLTAAALGRALAERGAALPPDELRAVLDLAVRGLHGRVFVCVVVMGACVKGCWGAFLLGIGCGPLIPRCHYQPNNKPQLS